MQLNPRKKCVDFQRPSKTEIHQPYTSLQMTFSLGYSWFVRDLADYVSGPLLLGSSLRVACDDNP